MDTRLAAVKSLIKILEHKIPSDETVSFYSDKVKNFSELVNLVYGAVKFKLALDFFIENLSYRKKISPPIKNILRLALYELEYLKTPDYAVINSYVGIAKIYDKNSHKFINAVLRNFLREKDNIDSIKLPDSGENTIKNIKNLSIKYSHPEWMIEGWIKQYGEEQTVKICEFNNKPPALSIRVNMLKISKEELKSLFLEKGIVFTESKISEESLILSNQGNIKKLPGFKEGLWAVQGESSCLVAGILKPKEGDKILDVCAAPGGKTCHIASIIKNNGEITALDISQKRISRIEENIKRLGVSCVKTIIADAENFSTEERFNRILIDAPCSNTGVLSKRPDARWNRLSEDIESLSKLQLSILNNISGLLMPGGVLVYSTCSIEKQENTFVIERFLSGNKNFKLLDTLQILQSIHNTEGFFIAKLQ